jgi:hypothetical protein
MSKIDDLARRLAERTSGTSDGVRGGADDPAFEQVARLLATPMSRRRAFRMAAAASLGASFFALRADRAYACRTCPTDPRGSNYPPEYTQFCGHPVGDQGACHYQCCLPTDECCDAPGAVVCCPAGTRCVKDPGPRCVCANQCGPEGPDGACCEPDEECVPPDQFNSNWTCLPPCRCDWENDCCGRGCCDADIGTYCCGSGNPDTDVCCPDDYRCLPGGMCGCRASESCGFNGCCGEGRVCCGDECCEPTRLDDILTPLRDLVPPSTFPGFKPAAGQDTAAVGRASAAPGPIDAVVAIGAVADLGALAAERIRSRRPDTGFRHAVRPPTARVRPIVAGQGLNAAAAKALTTMLVTEARAWALLYAAAVARARALSALRSHNMRAARAQSRASAAFAAKAAKALRRVPRLRAAAVTALRTSGTPEVTATAADIRAFQDAVRSNGLPHDLATRLSQLGLKRTERRRVAKLILARRADSLAGNLLIEPLADASNRAVLRTLAKRLSDIAARSRRHPITTHKPGPRRIPGSRPHVSAASRGRSRGAS